MTDRLERMGQFVWAHPKLVFLLIVPVAGILVGMTIVLMARIVS